MTKIKLIFGKQELTATLADNSSARALAEHLKKGDLKINLDDFASMEKVGPLGFSLPTNDENIKTNAGDIILYQGEKFVIYYGKNNWKFTRLGKIDMEQPQKLKELFGKGSFVLTLSLVH